MLLQGILEESVCVVPHTLGTERRLRVFENGVLRKISESKSDEATGEWRKLHNDELRDLRCAPNVIRVME
jgi:hypothetical protein